MQWQHWNEHLSICILFLIDYNLWLTGVVTVIVVVMLMIAETSEAGLLLC